MKNDKYSKLSDWWIETRINADFLYFDKKEIEALKNEVRKRKISKLNQSTQSKKSNQLLSMLDYTFNPKNNK